VLSADIDLVDIDGAHWRHWYELLVPARLRGQGSWALLFVDGAPPAHAVAGLVHDVVDVDGERDRGRNRGKDRVRTRGRIRPLSALTGPAGPAAVHVENTSSAALARTAHTLDVDAVVVVDVHVTTELYDDLARALAPGDLVAQGLTCLRACKRYNGRGIWTHPGMLEIVPPMMYESLQRTFDLLLPDKSSAVIYVIEDDHSDVHASLIAVKRSGDIELVTTHLGLEDALSGPDLARRWHHAYKRLLELVTQRYAPPSLAVFLQRKTFERIVTGPRDQLARELTAKNVIIDPVPAWLLGLLGGATMAAFASRGAKALARMLPSPARRMAADLAQTAQTIMRDSGAHPFDLLGFDPMALWNDLRQLYRR
jgi:hypothetical protein